MTPWVRRIIIANVVVFCAEMLQPDLKLALAFVPAYILVRPWTVITSMFVHDGFLHILFNMVTFFWFGPRVEERLGGAPFSRCTSSAGSEGRCSRWPCRRPG